MEQAKLNEASEVSFQGAQSVGDMSEREAWTPMEYAVVLSSNIRDTRVPLKVQEARLAALAQIGGGLSLEADRTTAETLSQHFSILEALTQRFSLETVKALNAGGKHAPEIADRYLAAAIRVQRAALAVLSALKVIRDSAGAPAPTTSVQGAAAAPQMVTLSGSD